jgi:serine/threonine protein kinase
MRFIHSKGYIHRDLKPDNILINGPGHALISDFGAVRAEESDATLTGEAGTVRYAAPELFREDGECTDRVDVFSFGSIVFEILTGEPVFPDTLRPFDVVRQHRSGQMPAIPELCGGFMQSLISECWSQDPGRRPSFQQIIERFQEAHFGIVPEASPARVRDYVAGVTSWELQHCC